MLYDVILIDVFNLIFKIKKEDQTIVEISNNFINYVESEIKSHLKEDGYLYLLFDPIVKSDLGISKYFSQSTDRQQIVPSYKGNRTFDSQVPGVAKFLKQYYTYRGDHTKIAVSEFLEADDYVEQIISKYPNLYIALLTTDFDWGKYLSQTTHLINKSFDKPFGVEEFIKKFKFKPTAASVSLHKALFGDASDNITGALNHKYNKNIKQHFELFEKWIQKVAFDNDSLDSLVKRFQNYRFIDVCKKEEKTFEEQCWQILNSPEIRINMANNFSNNLRVIQSRCKNVDKYILSEPENTKINNLYEQTLSKEKKSKFKFGLRRKKS